MNGKQTSEMQMNRNNKIQMSKDKRRNGQTSLEVTVAFIAAFILLLGAIKIFVWVNERIVLRQQDYEASRVVAASDQPGLVSGAIKYESDYPDLDIFGVKR